MEASIVDLRYKTSEILKALDNNESVTVKYHGKAKGIIYPITEKPAIDVIDHPFFAMLEDESAVLDKLHALRKPRYDI